VEDYAISYVFREAEQMRLTRRQLEEAVIDKYLDDWNSAESLRAAMLGCDDAFLGHLLALRGDEYDRLIERARRMSGESYSTFFDGPTGLLRPKEAE